MENAAHALAGLLVADLVVAGRGSAVRESRFPRLAAITSALANNVADADLVLTGLTGGKLGYLMHHRGHTHTLAVGVLLGLAVAAVVVAFARLRGVPLSVPDRRWIYVLGAIGPVVHVSMDAWNVYGVHPFWPIYSGWFYGDAVFILEPLLWLAAVPSLFLAARARWARGLYAFLGALGLVLPWLVPGFVPLAHRIGIAVFGAVVAFVVWRAPAARRAAVGVAAFAVVPLVFLATSAWVRGEVERLHATHFAGEEIHDAAMTSWPANPLCWSVITVSTTQPDGELVLRRMTVSSWPGVFDARTCPSRGDETTAPLVTVAREDSVAVRYEGEVRASLGRWRELATTSCEVLAMLRFCRVPFFIEGPGSLVVGDLRFDRGEELDFAEVELSPAPERCPPFVPGWDPPRRDVLGDVAAGAPHRSQ